MTPIPNRGFGIALGAHVYPLRLGIVTFGIGASVFVGTRNGRSFERRDHADGQRPAVTGEATLPVVTTRMTSLVPQLSINFGHRFGWSYLSAGYGPMRIDSSASAIGMLPAVSAPDRWNPR